jgi:choice-of-anchor B domain-containing protein
VGAPQQNEQEGAVYVYAYDDASGQWAEQRLLTGSTVDGQSHFGHAIAVEGDQALIGAPRVDGGVGQAFLFGRGDDAWREVSRLVPFDGRSNYRFGTAVGFNGTEAWIGAPGAARAAGRVYAFTYDADSGDWSSATKHGGTMASSRDFMAASLALDAATAVVGLVGADFGEGRAAIFTKDAETGAWTLTDTVLGEDRGLEAVLGDKLDCADGKAGRFDCERTDLVSFLPIKDVGGDRGTRINDVWGWTDSETGVEWVLLGRSDGTAFVDISDPENPFFAGDLPMTEGSRENVWRDMKVYENHVYIVADNAGEHGMQVFDLTQLRDVTEDEAPVTFTETVHYDKINSAHNIVINEESGYAYIVGAGGGGETCGGGLHMIDIRTPTEPTFVGCFADPSTGRAGTGYSHDAQCITYEGPDTEHQGKEICFGSNETALSIADVTNKENPVPLAVAEYPNVAYTHQGWITDDHRYFYVNDEIDEISGKVPETRTLIWDVTDLDDPQLIKEYSWGTTASDHNLYIDGNLMYMSNYASGLRIHDISDPENPVEVAHFDTSPGGSNGPGFTGTWSNYPYFESGVIPVSSINEGLFLIKKREANL